jgi:hypothetical protein
VWPIFFISLALALYALSIRTQLRFLFGPVKEVTGVVSEAEPFHAEGEDSRWMSLCTVHYEVNGRLLELRMTRAEAPQIGDAILLTYPAEAPEKAIEGDRNSVMQRHLLVILYTLGMLGAIVFFAKAPQ